MEIPDLPFAHLAVQKNYITQVQLDGVIEHWKKLSRQGVEVRLRELLMARGLLRKADALALAALEYEGVRDDATRFGRIAVGKAYATDRHVRAAMDRQAAQHRAGDPVKMLGDLLIQMGAIDRQQMRAVLQEMEQEKAKEKAAAAARPAPPSAARPAPPVAPSPAARPAPVLPPPPPPSGKPRSAQDEIPTLDEPAAAWVRSGRGTPATFAPPSVPTRDPAPPAGQDAISTMPEMIVPPELLKGKTPASFAPAPPPGQDSAPPAGQDAISTMPEMIVPPELLKRKPPSEGEGTKASGKS